MWAFATKRERSRMAYCEFVIWQDVAQWQCYAALQQPPGEMCGPITRVIVTLCEEFRQPS